MPSTRANHLWSGDRYLYLSNATETPSLAAFLQDNEVEKCFEPHNITLEHASLPPRSLKDGRIRRTSRQHSPSTGSCASRTIGWSESGFTHMACEEMWLGWGGDDEPVCSMSERDEVERDTVGRGGQGWW